MWHLTSKNSKAGYGMLMRFCIWKCVFMLFLTLVNIAPLLSYYYYYFLSYYFFLSYFFFLCFYSLFLFEHNENLGLYSSFYIEVRWKRVVNGATFSLYYGWLWSNCQLTNNLSLPIWQVDLHIVKIGNCYYK